MQVSVENTSTLGRRLTVQVPADEMQAVMRNKMAELSQKAQVPGFRPGKVPKTVLEQKFGAQLRQEAVNKVIESSLPEALEKNDLKPAGRPVVEHISNDVLNTNAKVNAETIFEYVVSFEIFPVFTLSDFSTIKAEKYVAEIKESDVDATLEKLINQFGNWVVVDRAAKMSDRLTVDYTSTMNGKPYENNGGQDVAVELGSQMFLEGFEEGLVGALQGEERVLNLTFPTNWRMEKLAGKPVQFIVTVKAVTEREPAKLDETFAKKLGASDASLQSIREKIRENLVKQVTEVVDARLKDQITDALLKLNPIPIPEALVEREISVLHEDLHRRMGDKPADTCQHQGLRSQAEKRVALGLILNEVIKLENLKPDPEQVKQRIDAVAKMFGNKEFLESMYYESEELLTGVQHTVLLDQALDVVVSKSTIIEKPISVEAIFKQNEQLTAMEELET